MSADERIFLYGASGHAKVVADVVERAGRAKVVALYDDNPALAGRELLGYRVAGGREALLAQGPAAGKVIVAIGANPARRAVAEWLASKGFSFALAVHPSAQVGREVRLGAGATLMAGVVINPDTEVGAHCIVNTAASIDHDCRIGEYVHVAPGARLCGGVSVGAGTLVGAGAVVAPGRRIGADAIIAAGAVVLADVPDRGVVGGNPARPLRDHEPAHSSR